MKQYALVAEFANKKLGFIIGLYDNERKAKSLIDKVQDSFEIYSLNAPLEIPSFYFEHYKFYKITGDVYFTPCKRYSEKILCTNGDPGVMMIKFRGVFASDEFIGYRNLINCYGVRMT